MKTWCRIPWCTALLASTACVSLDGASEGEDSGGGGTLTELPFDDSEMQGRHVLSKVLDQPDDHYVAVSTSAVDVFGKAVRLRLAGDASLEAIDPATGGVVHASGSVGLAGTVLEDPSDPDMTLTITRVVPESASVSQYELLYRTSTADPGVNPCEMGLAIPIAGYYDERAHHEATPGKLSFACKDEGVAEKCFRWNYPPGSVPGTDAWKAHQVCTRVARADYCKDGTTHTLDETYIQIWDTYAGLGFDVPTWTGPVYQGVAMWPPPPGVFKFEAAWPEKDDEPIICLSKTRWQGLQPGELDSCATPVPDPRTDASALFCEDMAAEGHPDLVDAVIVNASRYTDLRLEEWKNGSDHVSTVQGYHPGPWSGPGPRPVPVKVPFPGYTHVETQGTILRSLPGSILPGEVRQVWSYGNSSTGGRVLGRTDDPSAWPANGYAQGTPEGMVFIDPPEDGVPTVVPLYLYRNANTGDYFNSTLELDEPDYVTIDVLGHVVVLE